MDVNLSTIYKFGFELTDLIDSVDHYFNKPSNFSRTYTAIEIFEETLLELGLNEPQESLKHLRGYIHDKYGITGKISDDDMDDIKGGLATFLDMIKMDIHTPSLDEQNPISDAFELGVDMAYLMNIDEKKVEKSYILARALHARLIAQKFGIDNFDNLQNFISKSPKILTDSDIAIIADSIPYKSVFFENALIDKYSEFKSYMSTVCPFFPFPNIDPPSDSKKYRTPYIALPSKNKNSNLFDLGSTLEYLEFSCKTHNIVNYREADTKGMPHYIHGSVNSLTSNLQRLNAPSDIISELSDFEKLLGDYGDGQKISQKHSGELLSIITKAFNSVKQNSNSVEKDCVFLGSRLERIRLGREPEVLKKAIDEATSIFENRYPTKGIQAKFEFWREYLNRNLTETKTLNEYEKRFIRKNIMQIKSKAEYFVSEFV